MAQFAMPTRLKPDCTIFTVGHDDRGHWVVQENHGLMGGTFISREEAIHYAQGECRQYPGSIVLVTPQPLKLHIGGAGRA